MRPEDDYHPEFDEDFDDDLEIEDDDEIEDDWDDDYDDDYAEDYGDDMIAQEDDYGDDYADFWKRKGRGRRGRKARIKVRRSKRKARAANTAGRYVSRKDFDTTVRSLNREDAKNSSGIGALTKAARRTNSRVSANARVNAMQARQIAQMRKQAQLDGAVEFAKAYDPSTGSIDLLPVISGILKTNMLGTPRGFLANPLAIGAIAVALKQDDDGNTLLSNLFGNKEG